MRNKRPASRDLSAWTLIELIVVLVILAIAAAVIVPNFAGASSFQAVSAARMIAADLQYAQNMAVTFQSPVTVSFNENAESYTLSNASGPLIHPMTKSAYTIDFATQDGFENLDIVSATFAGATAVQFDELGTPDNAGSVTVRSGANVYRVDVGAATGRVTVTRVGT